MTAPIQAVKNAICMLVAAVCFLVGVISLSSDGKTLSDIPWYQIEESSRGLYFAPGGIAYTYDYGVHFETLKWSDCKAFVAEGPTTQPSSATPSSAPSDTPSSEPSTAEPSSATPSKVPSVNPSSVVPSSVVPSSLSPSKVPSSAIPSAVPSTATPSINYKFCDAAMNSGPAAGILCIIALILSLVACAINVKIARSGEAKKTFQYCSVGFTVVSFIFSIAALGSWSSVEKYADEEFQGFGEQGPGWIIVLIGLLFNVYALIMGIFYAIGGDKNPSTINTIYVENTKN